MHKGLISLCMVLVVSFFMLQGCDSPPKKPEERGKYVIPDSLRKTLTIDTVRMCPLVNDITFTGMVDFNQDNQVNIFALISGNVHNVKVQLGDYVKKGEVLATIRSSEMAGYSNNLVVAQTNLTAAKKQLDASQDLFKSGLASQLDVTSAQVNYDQAVAQLEMVKRVLRINGDSTNGEFVIKSPINGFIVQKNITNNTAIRADNNTNIFTISDLKNVWVQANVYEANIGNIQVGNPVRVTTLSSPGKVFNGRIDKIMNVLDPTNKVLKVRVVLPNNDLLLKPQMFASVTVSNPQNRNVLCISSRALVYENSQYFVLVYHGNGHADIAPVDVLGSAGDTTYLNSGVKEGDQLVATMAFMIFSELNN